MTSARFSHFPTKWFVNSISSSTICFSNADVIPNPLHKIIEGIPFHRNLKMLIFGDLKSYLNDLKLAMQRKKCYIVVVGTHAGN